MNLDENLSLESFLLENTPELIYIRIPEVQKLEIKRNIQKLKDFHAGAFNVATPKEQGDLLENVIASIIKGISIFSYIQNSQTSGNEIDLGVRLTKDGELLLKKYPHLEVKDFPYFFRIECKNYKSEIEIGLVNKFHSLLETNGVEKVGFFITYKGLKGQNMKGWYSTSGLVKKIALKHCVDTNLPLIIDIDINKLDRLIELNFNFFEWIDEMKVKLLNDVNSDFKQGVE